MLQAPIERIRVSAYVVPTRAPEADGTLEWDRTTLVLAEIAAAGVWGLGWTYAETATARFIEDALAPHVAGMNALDIPKVWSSMVRAIRNFGRPGVASMAISAVDVALWDLKAKLLGLPLVTLLGAAQERVRAYGSGGFIFESPAQMEKELEDWIAAGLGAVKIKVGRDPRADLERVRAARSIIGKDVELFVDANGAYQRKQALLMAEAFAREGVTWFEEPVSSDDLAGLSLIRDRLPPGMRLSAGEYGYDLFNFQRLLPVVDVLQADATRCAGISELLRVAALCEAASVPLSTHCAPALHLHAACAVAPLLNVELFFDHLRIERRLFDGAPSPIGGFLEPDRHRPGMGLELRRREAERFAA